ncbi:adenylate/guanylate cyclase domain-containing protein [Carboxylicivirga sp. M1479]|uniref:adenylate/guanylate cyclase domain-containing protein n=1 Tax=Carboxylicivirga sp. M1479 TaxID=2594476 RepID=UPI0011773C53|nr:adenylate/guanylate cyclase domain-containing protein [Carboxylicivirga sp. M1479]TRX64253.1 HD domain-containing protein [Carboxylicivirga sp. M1479]
MESIEDYILRITKLANRNKELNDQLQGLVGRYEVIQKQNEKYLNLLSEYSYEEIEERLKQPSKKRVKRFKMVSILYATFDGFDRLNDHAHPQELVDALDELYLNFDDIAKKYGILKVKTIGDTFLYAGGILEENRTNPIDVVNMALEMQIAAKNCIINGDKEAFWKVNIGIHTGPVLGEPTGKKNSPYTLTGESTNIASRMGMACKGGDINISVMTYELIKEFFSVEENGHMPAKYKGFLDMYKVNGIRYKLSIDRDGIRPNQRFKTKYNLIQFMDIQEELLDILEQKLPENLYYHNIKHTIDVVTEVELIGWAEGLKEEEILLLKLAGLFHDCGHTIDYKEHELHGAQIARDILTNYKYPKDQIDTVCRLIMSTKFPPEPKDILEQVICDSDLDYLGRSDFIPVSNTLFQELKERSMIGTIDEWNQLQLSFIKKHQYYTETARNLRQINKESQIERLEGLLNIKVKA